MDYNAEIFQSMHSTDPPLPSCHPRQDIIIQRHTRIGDGATLLNKRTKTTPGMYTITIHLTSCTIYHTPYTIYHTPYTIYHIPYFIYHTPYT
ncbi:hypothetical protein EON63_09085, partial [archaeon]